MAMTPEPPEFERLDIPLGDKVPENLEGDIVDPAKFVQEIQAAVPDPLKIDPHSTQHLVDALLLAIRRFLEQNRLPQNLSEVVVWGQVDGAALSEDQRNNVLQIVRDFWRTRDLLEDFHATLTTAMRDLTEWMRVGDDGVSKLYREVVGPLIDGQCYGPPVCSEAALSTYGSKPMGVVPVVARPFITMRAFGVLHDGAYTWFHNLSKSVGESIADFSKATAGAIDTISESVKRATVGSESTLRKLGRVALWTAGGVAGVWLALKLYRSTRPGGGE